MNLLTRMFSKPAEPADPRRERQQVLIAHQWRAHDVLGILSDIEHTLQVHHQWHKVRDYAEDAAGRDAVAEIVAKYRALGPWALLYPDNPHDRLTIAETCMAAIVATLADPAMADRPADQLSDIQYYIKKDWHDSRREKVPSWYRRPGTGTYYPGGDDSR